MEKWIRDILCQSRFLHCELTHQYISELLPGSHLLTSTTGLCVNFWYDGYHFGNAEIYNPWSVTNYTDEMVGQIIDFIKNNRKVDTLLVHRYAGQSRSRAVGAFAVKMLGGDNSRYFSQGNPNMYVYDTLETVWMQEILHETNR